ncbi:FAD-dependent oxidoreductase [Desulfovibrio sulfodismutans]|uniref:FAD-dependent oxidoreductase n=1 Tax=Desulfolutivibrio sulfodismutans TaxID=63561 RepID=A0A7K3NJB2_9BACT|nr:FAD-dependent oxidoreductase [Desulfolutivibrio sulfodismutans]NDY55893.1 FAD-dependent oxidoreductase [Desulfolutivibrio sulfodismutans]QLA11158.1 FAD-binding protein [Desulfolutivibrio sulfodismutans DSM 3696]
MKRFDAVVIGGGPAGMTAALYLLRSQASVAVVEKLSPGGQMLMTHMIENYPGFPDGIEGWKLADAMAAHVDKYPHVKIADEVMAMEPVPGGHRIRVGGEWIEASVVVLCVGARYKRVGIPGEKELLGKGVSYCALCDGNFFRNQVVAVIGGGNAALEESLYLSRLVKKLYLIHRRDDFRGQKCFQDKCEVTPVIEILRSSVVTEIQGTDKVTGILVENKKTGHASAIPVDGVFVFVGFEPQGDFYPAGLERDPAGFVVTDACMRTNIPGLYAAGDIRSKECRQVATAVGEGAAAAHAALAYLESLGRS